MKAKHTPGPWIAVGLWVEHSDDRVADICNCNTNAMSQEHLGRSNKEMAANARLIAAAPEMLEALQELVGWVTTAPQKYVDAANAAIAKATGNDA